MPAPVVALAATAKPVTEVIQGVVKVLSTDIVTFKGKVYRRIRKRIPLEKDGVVLLTPKGRVRMVKVETLEPIDIGLNLNPIGIGILGILGAATAFVLFGRVGGALPFGGEFTIYEGPFANEFDAWKGVWNEKREKKKNGDAEHEACATLKTVYDLSFGPAKDAALNEARRLGCAW